MAIHTQLDCVPIRLKIWLENRNGERIDLLLGLSLPRFIHYRERHLKFAGGPLLLVGFLVLKHFLSEPCLFLPLIFKIALVQSLLEFLVFFWVRAKLNPFDRVEVILVPYYFLQYGALVRQFSRFQFLVDLIFIILRFFLTGEGGAGGLVELALQFGEQQFLEVRNVLQLGDAARPL